MAIWYENTYKQPISRLTLSNLLSEKWDWLDECELLPEDKKRSSPTQWPILDKALLEWQLEKMSREISTSLKLITSVAKQIWEILPEECKYNSKTGKKIHTPHFSAGWIESFKRRHQFTFKEGFYTLNSVPKEPIKLLEEIRLTTQDTPLNRIYNVMWIKLVYSDAEIPTCLLIMKNRLTKNRNVLVSRYVPKGMVQIDFRHISPETETLHKA